MKPCKFDEKFKDGDLRHRITSVGHVIEAYSAKIQAFLHVKTYPATKKGEEDAKIHIVTGIK